MPTNGHTEARKLHSRLKHPIVDADGHWAEFVPLMREEFRRIGGDTAVEALDMASAAHPELARMSVAERRRRRIGQEAFWFLPTKNTLDRATAMMPRLLYERLDDLGLDFCVVYPTAGLGYYRLPPEKLRRALCRAYNMFTAEQFRPYADRIIPAAIIPMYSPEEAIEELEFASQAARLEGVHDGRSHPPPDPRARRGASRGREVRRVVRRDRHRQRARLRSGVGEVPRAEHRAELPQGRALDPAPQLAVELLLQPHRPLRLRRRSDGQGPLLRRRHPPLPRAELRLPGRRRGLGVLALRRSHRPLGEAQPAGAREHEPRAARPRALLALAEKYAQAAVLEAVRRGEGWTTTATARAASRTSTTTRAARSRARKTSTISTSSASTSAARPTIRSTRGPSTGKRCRWARASTRSSARTSATSTCRT